MKRIETIRKRLSRIVYISIAGLFTTDLIKAKMVPKFHGHFQSGNTYFVLPGAKNILVIIMIVIAIFCSKVIGRNMIDPSPKVIKTKTGMLMVNMLQGIIVLLLSRFNSQWTKIIC